MRRVEDFGVSAISDAVMAQIREEEGELIHPVGKGRWIVPYIDYLVRDARNLAEQASGGTWKHPTRRGTRARYDNDEVTVILNNLKAFAGQMTMQGRRMRRSGSTPETIDRLKSKMLSEPH